ncbi:hypothetical protein ACIOHE_39305 [Streptomyces sp. NPDC087851]|uniref:hypothetical protein n=1 Tax=Streptomyces sp. NPDC087851 TaxID=3365810 RepID=UPI00380AA47E
MSTITAPWRRGTGTHRADDRIADLTTQLEQMQRRQEAADDFHAVLMDDRTQLHALWQAAEYKAACSEDVVSLHEATIDALTSRAEAAERRAQEAMRQAEQQERELRELRALRSLTRTAPAPTGRAPWCGAERDTEPIDVSVLRADHHGGRVVPLHRSPYAQPTP